MDKNIGTNKTLAEWAKDSRCGVCYMTLWRAVHHKELRATRPLHGKKWMVSEADFLEYIHGESNLG